MHFNYLGDKLFSKTENEVRGFVIPCRPTSTGTTWYSGIFNTDDGFVSANLTRVNQKTPLA